MGSKKVVKQREHTQKEKRSKNIEKIEGYLRMHPIWAFRQCDQSHERWSLKNSESFYQDILEKLVSYEGMTWGEIQAASGGKSAGNGTNNHFESIADMSKEAQKRAEELRLDVDQLFSLRLTGKKRLYGILDQGIYRVIWYDPEHEIYSTSKNR